MYEPSRRVVAGRFLIWVGVLQIFSVVIFPMLALIYWDWRLLVLGIIGFGIGWSLKPVFDHFYPEFKGND